MSKTFCKIIQIPAYMAERITNLLTNEPEDEERCMSEDEVISYSAKFADGVEMDVKVCGVQYEEGSCNTAWTEAVLFDHGAEVACSEPQDAMDGDWELEYNGNRYIVSVVFR